MHPRRTARESILGALYAYELTGEEKNKVLLDAFERNSFDASKGCYAFEFLRFCERNYGTMLITYCLYVGN